MAKKDFQKFVRENEGFILSSGTLNLAHLLAKSYDHIRNNSLNAKTLQDDILSVFKGVDDFDKNESLTSKVYYSECEIDNDLEINANEIWNEDVYNYFSSLSPNNYYFGSSEGDGALIGWFKLEEE